VSVEAATPAGRVRGVKALVRSEYGEPREVLRVADVDVPEPGRGEIRVRVAAAGIDAGLWHMTTGLPLMMRLGTGLRAPRSHRIGRDFAGTVEAVGAGVKDLSVGDEVFGFAKGSLAEYALADAKKVALKPGGIPFEEAAVLPVSGETALEAVRDFARIRPGHRVLVIGAGGGVGSFAVQFAKAAGAHVTALCSTGKVGFVESLGAADEVIDYTKTDVFDGNHRYQAIIDTGGRRSLGTLRDALMPYGVAAIVGGEGGGRVLGGMQRQLLWAPFYWMRSSCRMRPVFAGEKRKELGRIAALVLEGDVKVPLARRIGLDDAPSAIAGFPNGSLTGKTVVSFD